MENPCSSQYLGDLSNGLLILCSAYVGRYLHEVCQPPVVHRNFKSANILLDDDLDVRVSDCGLAPLITSGSVSQVSLNPVFESAVE